MDRGIDITRLSLFLNELASARRGRTRFLFAAGTLLLALVGTAVSQWLFGSVATLIFGLAVVVCTGIFGLVAGLLTAAAAALTLDFFYLPPIFGLSFNSLTGRVWAAFVALAAGTHILERRLSARIRSELKPELGMHGSLDGVVDGELYGWAFDADHPAEPVIVTISLDRHPVAAVAAVHYRSDVAAAMNCSGRHGFHIDLSPYLPNASGAEPEAQREAWIDVRLPNGQPVTDAPALLRVSAVKPRPPRPTVLFMHIPKTAGTAFREAIAANYLQSEIAYLYPSPPGFLVSDLRALPIEQRRAYRVVIGHYQFGMHEALPQSSEYITVVRHPAARVLSQYAFSQQTQPELTTFRDGRPVSLPEIFEKRLTVDFDNAMVRCFSGVDERACPPGHLTRSVYEQAVHNLRTFFTFVGHQESSAEAYAWLRQNYGWSAVQDLPVVNLGPLRDKRGMDESLESAIRYYNSWDYLLYEEIGRVFPLERPPATGSVARAPGSSAQPAVPEADTRGRPQ